MLAGGGAPSPDSSNGYASTLTTATLDPDGPGEAARSTAGYYTGADVCDTPTYAEASFGDEDQLYSGYTAAQEAAGAA